MKTNKLPVWIRWLTAGYAVSNLLIFGFPVLINPGFGFPDLGGTAADFPIQFFAVRHIALGVPLVHGLMRQDAKILRVMYTIFLVIGVFDLGLLILNGYYIPIFGDFALLSKILIGLTFFVAPSALALKSLRRVE